ncbi:MAG: hypothetical protein Q4B86_06425 [Eubacteriales bacterium]|nr:hypothetical protein [Eubacteriales bacterium]
MGSPVLDCPFFEEILRIYEVIKMIDITFWMNIFLHKLDESFGKRVILVDKNAVNRAIKIGVCNIFHGCVHNMLHEKSDDILRNLYKSASFVVQAIIFMQTGNYVKLQEEILVLASPDEKIIINTFFDLKNGGTVEFDSMSERLFIWSKKWISTDNKQIVGN